MLHVVAGRLAEDCKIKDITRQDGTTAKVVNNTVYIWDGIESHEDIPVKIEAWDTAADEIAKYKKGQVIHFIGKVFCAMRKPKGSEKEFATLVYRVIKVDEKRLMLKEFNKLLSEYVNTPIENENKE